MHQRTDDRSLGDLFSDLASETSTLVRQEIDLARTEMTEKASRAGKDVGFMAAGGIIAYAGFLVILAGIVMGLTVAGLPAWASAFLVGVVVAGIGYFLIQKGLSALKHTDLAPRQTMETLKEDRTWASQQVT